MNEATQRIDVWLWRARLFKSRALAVAAILAGQVRIVRGVQSRLVEKPGTSIAPSDGLSIAIGGRVRSLTIKALPMRRGPAREAALLYVEHGARTLDEAEAADHVCAAEEGTDAT